jgi:hypothetical protein
MFLLDVVKQKDVLNFSERSTSFLRDSKSLPTKVMLGLLLDPQ